VAAALLSHQETPNIALIPTGAGKTYVQMLIACYYIQRGTKVVIVEPNDMLRVQTKEYFIGLSEDIEVVTIDWFYNFPMKHEVVIVNEFDHIVETKCYFVSDL
jgi:superfamily II DNA or RNA helicase